MASKSGVILVTREPKTEREVVALLHGDERLEAAGVLRGLQDLEARLLLHRIPLAVIDIDPGPTEMLQDLEGLAARFQETRFVVVSNELRNDLVLEAMQAGARHFLVKENLGANLLGTLLRLVPNNVISLASSGSLVTVLSVSGGCGATTVSVNVANELQILTEQPVLLVDLDTAYGAVAAYLDLKGEYGVADVLGSPGRIDAEFIRSTALPYTEDYQVLVSPASLRNWATNSLDFSLLDDMVKACRAAYTYTVVDAPRVSRSVAATLAKNSRRTFLVLQLTVKDLRAARSMWTTLRAEGIEPDQVLVVANRFRKRKQMVTLDDVKKSLPDLSVEPIWNDYRSAIVGLNYGQPLAKAAPRSVLRRSIEALARSVAQVPATQT